MRGLGADARWFFPPLARVQSERSACTDPTAYGLHLTRWACRSLQPVVVEQAAVAAIHYTTGARILAEASLQPHRSRYGKTAVLDEELTTRAAKGLWCYERVEGLRQRGEVVICMDEKPNLQALSRARPRQPMPPGQLERHEFEYNRHGTVTFQVACTVYEDPMQGWGLDKTDPEHFLWCVRQGARRYRHARRIPLIMENGSSHSEHPTKASFATHPRLRALYTPAHARGLNQAQLLLRALTDKYLARFDCESRQQLIAHLTASWPESNHRFAHPFSWSWPRRPMYTWAEKKGAAICTKTYATVH